MTWLWIPVTIAAALLQNIRTALQKHLKGRLSTNAATYTRYVFGFPLAILYLAALNAGFGRAPPAFNGAGLDGAVRRHRAALRLVERLADRPLPWPRARAVRAGFKNWCVASLPCFAGRRTIYRHARRGSPSWLMCADACCGASARRAFAARGFP